MTNAIEQRPAPDMHGLFNRLLRAANITRLIVVDDKYATAPDRLGTLLSVAQTRPEAFASILPWVAVDAVDNPELLPNRLRSHLGDENELDRIWQALAAANEIETEPENGLDALLAGVENVIRRSGTAWRSEANQLLADDGGAATLVLVDRDFRNENLGENFGLDIIKSIHAANGRAYCALFSHTVQPDAEIDTWTALSTDPGLNRARFVVISKERLSAESPDLAGFLQLIRLAILCGPLAHLQESLHSHYEAAAKQTKDELESWNVFDFDQAVFASSREEGVWEGDTLFRVWSSIATSTARQAMLADSALRELIALARRASSVDIPRVGLHPWSGLGAKAHKYQRAEVVIPGEFVNPHNLPVELGDVFRRGEGEERWVLLAQPCDLMVRADGERTHDEDMTRQVPLCKIVKEPKPNGQTYELKCWNDDGTPAYINFAGPLMIRLLALDLCAFNADGKSTFVRAASTPASNLCEPWREFFAKVRKQLGVEFDKVAQIIDAMSDPKSTVPSALRPLAVKKLLPCFSSNKKITTNRIEGGLAVNVKRVSRLMPHVAADALRAFADFQARTAFERPVLTDALREHLPAARIATE